MLKFPCFLPKVGLRLNGVKYGKKFKMRIQSFPEIPQSYKESQRVKLL